MQINGEVIGLDIGREHISAVTLLQEGEEVSTVGVAEIGLPQGVWSVEGRLQEPAILIRALKNLRKNIKPRPKRAYLAIDAQQLLLQPTTKPRKLEKDEIAAAVRFDLEPSLPYDPEEAQISYSILGPEADDEDLLRVLAVACDRSVPIELIRAAQSAGFQVEDIEPGPCIIARSIQVGQHEWPELLVDIGQTASSAVVVCNQLCEYAQSLTFGGEQLSQAIATVSEQTVAQAEQWKKRHSLIAPAEDPFEKQRNAMVQWADNLTEAIYEVLSYQAQRDPARRVILCGGASRLDGLLAHINQSLGVPVEQAEPIEGLKVQDEERFSELTQAYALALHPAKASRSLGKKVTKSSSVQQKNPEQGLDSAKSKGD
jgi:type IV pilus assembly protein PilM